MQQLQEQLQLNLIQQTHILQSTDKKKASGSLQQLALQQQQLIQQLQIIQRQYVVHQGIGMQPLMMAQSQGTKRVRKLKETSSNVKMILQEFSLFCFFYLIKSHFNLLLIFVNDDFCQIIKIVAWFKILST